MSWCVADGDAFEELRQLLEAESCGNVEQTRFPRVRLQRHELSQLTEGRTRAPAPRHAAQAVSRAAHREEMPDRAKAEIERGQVGDAGNQNEQRAECDERDDEQQAIDEHPT